MIQAGVANLIAESPQAHGIFDAPAETTRKVYCTVKSVGQTEVYQAKAAGLNPELKLILAHAFEYKGEKLLEYQGERYGIIRTYRTETDGIELTIQKVTGNAKPIPVPDTPVTTETPAETEPEVGTDV
jgi:SPP1 family predicted phage head-tail adaptor